MHHLRKTLAALVFGMVLASLSQLSASAGEPPRPENAFARVNVGPTSVDWSPTVDYERLVLTIVGPDGFVSRQELVSGQTPLLSLFDKNGKRLSDGIYRYELRILPRGGEMKNPLQGGALWVKDGSFVAPDQAASRGAGPSSGKPARTPSIVMKDSVVPDDLVVQGTACIGPNCLNGDPDATNTLKLKGRFPRILFDDIAGTGCCFPATDWILQANTDPYGPDFFLQEAFSLSIPFYVTQGAPSYTLAVTQGGGFSSTSGRVGVNTPAPLQPLHVVSDTGPTIRLEQPVSPGPARTWDVGANDTQFFVRDVTNSSALPLQIQAGAPTNSLYVAASGSVGIGTPPTPSVQFHVGAGEVRFPPGSGTAGWTVFNYHSDAKNYIRGTTIIADTGGSVGIGTTAPSSKLHVNGGDIRVSGGSFIDDGVTLNAPDYVFEPSYKLLPLEKLKEFVAQEKHLPNVPNAREVRSRASTSASSRCDCWKRSRS